MQNLNGSTVLQKAKILWDFLCAGRSRTKCDLLVACGSYDLRVCDYACALLKEGYADKLIVSGNTGNWTKHLWSETEAEVFYKRALNQGISAKNIFREERATNLAENIIFSSQHFPEAKSILFITKPNTVRRLGLSIPINNPNIIYYVDAPDFEFPWGVSNSVGVLGLIDEMVGDLHRIIEYPKIGYQKECALPYEVLDAWKFLISEKFDRHLLVEKF
ncbi:YdcF family protein [Fluviispira multicolorata]|uniref:YdcF family protein n=1 Tax=Fluviispira multicolorata TaxID=2654512 RepID=A0A833JDN8_9BACT|nr:YdcF family protein [Fluviispira multicolorata]KAB8031983.1 YdcF family protein [Fluviispira multicolorata]